MQAVRDKWTDERLDDLNGRVSEGFARLDSEIRSVRGELSALRGEMNVRFEAMEARMDARFSAVDARFDAIDSRFDSLHRLLLAAAGGALGILLTTAGALVATQL